MEESCKLEFIEPACSPEGKLFAKIPKSEIKPNIEKWRNTLVGYVVGNKPFYMQLKACVTRIWNSVEEVE